MYRVKRECGRGERVGEGVWCGVGGGGSTMLWILELKKKIFFFKQKTAYEID